MASDSVFYELSESYKILQSKTLKYMEHVNNSEEPETEHGAAISVLFSQIQSNLDQIITDTSADDESYIKVIAMKASVLYEKAKIFMSLNLNKESFGNLEEARDIVQPLKDNKFIVYLYLRIMNHVSYILSKLGDFSKAKILLEEVLENTIPDDVIIYNTEELFSSKESDKSLKDSKIHRLRINNIQMLSWVYSKMCLNTQSSIQQHLILSEELKFGEIDPIEWATKCARVAILHLTQENWVTSRYYLSIASTTMNRLNREMAEHPMLKKAFAELARGWIYYGLRLFDSSRSKEMERACDKLFDDETCEDQDEDIALFTEQPLDPTLIFPDYDVELESVPATLVQTASVARALFTYTQAWMVRARMFYTLREHPFVHVNCILDLSELYRYLAYFDTDLEAQYVYQQRRSAALDTLCAVLKEVRPQCYAAVSVELFRELAEVQIEMLGLNLKRIAHLDSYGDTATTTTTEGNSEAVEMLQRRIDATMNIQGKLEKFGDSLGHDSLSELDDEVKSVPGKNEDMVKGIVGQDIVADGAGDAEDAASSGADIEGSCKNE